MGPDPTVTIFDSVRVLDTRAGTLGGLSRVAVRGGLIESITDVDPARG